MSVIKNWTLENSLFWIFLMSQNSFLAQNFLKPLSTDLLSGTNGSFVNSSTSPLKGLPTFLFYISMVNADISKCSSGASVGLATWNLLSTLLVVSTTTPFFFFFLRFKVSLALCFLSLFECLSFSPFVSSTISFQTLEGLIKLKQVSG